MDGHRLIAMRAAACVPGWARPVASAAGRETAGSGSSAATARSAPRTRYGWCRRQRWAHAVRRWCRVAARRSQVGREMAVLVALHDARVEERFALHHHDVRQRRRGCRASACASQQARRRLSSMSCLAAAAVGLVPAVAVLQVKHHQRADQAGMGGGGDWPTRAPAKGAAHCRSLHSGSPASMRHQLHRHHAAGDQPFAARAARRTSAARSARPARSPPMAASMRQVRPRTVRQIAAPARACRHFELPDHRKSAGISGVPRLANFSALTRR